MRLAALGDAVLTSSLVGAIRARDPAAHVTWLCGRRIAPLVRLFAGVDEVLEVDEGRLLAGGFGDRVRGLARLWHVLLPRRFDVTLIAHADERYRWAFAPVRAGRLRMLRPHRSGRMLPIPARYLADEYARLLDDDESPRGPVVGHIPLATLRRAPPTPADADGIGVVLVPGGARNVVRESALRRWPVDRYRAVAAALLAEGIPVTLVGDGADEWVRPTFEGLAVRDEIGRTDVEGTLGLLAHASLVVTHDTGPLHLAALVRAPIIGVFGPTMPTQFLPTHPGAEALWGGAGLACRPCYDGREFAACTNNLCVQDVAAETVLRRALAVLRGGARTSAPRAIFPG